MDGRNPLTPENVDGNKYPDYVIVNNQNYHGKVKLINVFLPDEMAEEITNV